MNLDEIKRAIRSVYSENIDNEREINNFFVPWFIHNKFGINHIDALSYSSSGIEGTGRNDAGIDGFYFENLENNKLRLWIFQGKLTDNIDLILKGFDDLIRASKTLSNIIRNQDTGLNQENYVIMRLREELNSKNASIHEVYFCLLSAADRDAITTVTRFQKKSKDSFDKISQNINSNNNFAQIILLLFGNNDYDGFGNRIIGGKERVIRFYGEEITSNNNVRAFIGLVYLSDIVELYKIYRNNFFDKNVRYYLRKQANKEESAANKIKDTLKKICIVKELEPDLFPLMHNGIYIYAPSGEYEKDQNRFILNPLSQGIFILNGCQTIFTAHSFYEQEKELDKNIWTNIKIPCKIILTNDESITNSVAINSNRQTAIEPSALWANDAAQRRLQELFGEQGVYYERQKDAYETLRQKEDFYINYPNGVIKIEELARVIAASNKEISLELALKPRRIFESDDNYRKVFNDKILEVENIARLLMAYTNMYNAVNKWLKNDSRDYMQNIEPSKYTPVYFRILLYYLHYKENYTLIIDNLSRVYKNNLNDAGLYFLKNNIERLINTTFQQEVRNECYIRREYEGWNGQRETIWEWVEPSNTKVNSIIINLTGNRRVNVFDTSFINQE